MLRPFAFITHQGSHVKGDILPGVGSVASGHSLTFPKNPETLCSQNLHGLMPRCDPILIEYR
jgi:hypothetical protein